MDMTKRQLDQDYSNARTLAITIVVGLIALIFTVACAIVVAWSPGIL